MKIPPLFIPIFFLVLAAASPSFFPNEESVDTWNPDAGVVTSFTEGAKVIASSNQVEAWKAVDGDDKTAWLSGAPSPTGFLTHNNQNFLLGQKLVSTTQNGENAKAVDGNLNTYMPVEVSQGKQTVEISTGSINGEQQGFMYLKCEVKSTLFIYQKTAGSNAKKIGEYLPEENYSLKKIRLPESLNNEGFMLRSTDDFLLFEIAGIKAPITEYVIFDFGKSQPVGVLKTRHWAGEENAISTKAYLSKDGTQWDLVAELEPDAQHSVLTKLDKEIPARYLKIEHELVERDWNKVFLWEVDAYNKYGPYGPRPPANLGAVSLREMLGVNGYWSWGTLTCSADLPKGEGPWRYAPVASHGRNYHDLTWDINSPGQAIDFSKMKTEGTPAKAWLRWDDEYQTWVDAGMNVQASLQFFRFSPDQWKNPEKEAFAYAKAFTQHFGLTAGNGLVCSVEAGNEPWKYPADIYQKILLGVARGAKSGDSSMEVFPCALQAADPQAEESGIFKNYIGARVTPEAARLLDGINIHAYSYLTPANGKRKAVNPEHPLSTFWEILNAIRWRDANMPGKKIYLSEWGWDSDGGGEACTHDECVSEQAASSYAIRAALIASRLGIERATWFFYANENQASSLYSRSGLTASKSHDFAKKKTFHALHSLVEQVGDCYFDKIIREDEIAWVYQFADKYGTPTAIISWRPIDGDETDKLEFELKTKHTISETFRLDGTSAAGSPVQNPREIKGGYLVENFATPTLFKIAPN